MQCAVDVDGWLVRWVVFGGFSLRGRRGGEEGRGNGGSGGMGLPEA